MVLLYGHRGARGEAPENTTTGFRYARALYLDGVHLDLRLSSDNQLVVIHDETVDRTTTRSGQVARLTATALAKLDARAAFPNWPEAAGVPTLDDALDAASGVPRLLLSLQPDEPRRLKTACERLAETLERRWIPDRVIVLSHSQTAIQAMRAVAPFATYGLSGWFEHPGHLDDAKRMRCRHIAAPLSTGSERLVREAHASDLEVIGWLGNTPDEVGMFASWGVDAIVSDFPTVAGRKLAELSSRPR